MPSCSDQAARGAALNRLEPGFCAGPGFLEMNGYGSSFKSFSIFCNSC